MSNIRLLLRCEFPTVVKYLRAIEEEGMVIDHQSNTAKCSTPWAEVVALNLHTEKGYMVDFYHLHDCSLFSLRANLKKMLHIPDEYVGLEAIEDFKQKCYMSADALEFIIEDRINTTQYVNDNVKHEDISPLVELKDSMLKRASNISDTVAELCEELDDIYCALVKAHDEYDLENKLGVYANV